MKHRRVALVGSRKGAVAVLAAFLMVIMLGLIALSVDVGYMLVVRTQLQVAADSAALAAGAQLAGTRAQVVAAAQQFSRYHTAGGKAVDVATADVEYGMWDSALRSFTPSGSVGNALRVTTRRDATTGGNALFFGRILGQSVFSTQASAVALGNPRDICFVVDLSASMNRDTEPRWGNGAFSGQYAPIRTQMMQTLFSDLGFGSYPGTSQWIGQTIGADSFSDLTSSSSSNPLRSSSIPAAYRITWSDSLATRRDKAYRWLCNVQIPALMGNVKPPPNIGANLNYWKEYIDDCTSHNAKLGFQTYCQFMIENGRDQRPDGTNYTPLSISSPHCQKHTESTAGGTFWFPPREQPTHACRRSIIAALNEIKSKNSSISDPSQKDWVSIVTFDKLSNTTLAYSLDSDYDEAMEVCTDFQAAGQNGAATATETGLIAGQNHIKAESEGGFGRENTQKVVVLLTDGMANAYSSSNTAIGNYRSANPSSNFYGGGSYAPDAAIMQADLISGRGWKMYGIGMGTGQDVGFMDRMARMGGTANDDGESPHTSGDPSMYEVELTNIFKQIIDNPQVRLVQ